MKNQYVGDVNDYRKYGLLRALTGNGKLGLGICWMLTPDDQRADGSRTAYLQRASQYRRSDPELFDQLATWVGSGTRGIDFVAGSGLLPGALFHSELIPDDGPGRKAFFEAAFKNLAEAELVFFDPDNGFEIDSCRPGQKGSNRYLCWNEAQSFFDRGQSVIVYQHFARENREIHIQRLVEQMGRRFNGAAIFAFRTPHVVFLLAAQATRRAWFEARCEELRRNWDQDQIACRLDNEPAGGVLAKGETVSTPLLSRPGGFIYGLMAGCPFCSVSSDRIVAENQHTLAIRDGYPVSEGHTLVIPRRHVPSLFELAAEEQRDVWKMVEAARRILIEELRPDGFNIGINDGAAAGQTVAHAHIHVIPRYSGDVPDPRGGVRWIIPAKAVYWSGDR